MPDLLRKWSYRVTERLAFGNGRWHMLVCPFCRGMVRYIRNASHA